MTLVRVRLLPHAMLAMLSCPRPAAVDPGGPVVAPGYTGPVVGALERSPAPEPAPTPDPPPTWAWARSVLPELAEHSEVDPRDAVLARFGSWSGPGGSLRVHVLLDGACHAVEGSMARDGFHGRFREEVTVKAGERTVSAMDLAIGRDGITMSGPSGTIHVRDARGRWQEAGGFGGGRVETLVERSMSAADEQSVTLAGYRYWLEPVCDARTVVTQACIDGGERRCERCTGVGLRRGAPRMTWARKPVVTTAVREPGPVDCARPCPADEWTPRLPRLAEVLAGRRFHGVVEGEGPVVFRSAAGCARARQRAVAAAAPSARSERARSR